MAAHTARTVFFLFLLLMAAAGRLTEVATLFGVLVLHELAHIAAARRRGMLVSHVELTPIGGVAHIDAPLGSTLPRNLR